MATLEDKLKTSNFWLMLGVANHSITLAVIALGCIYSGFTCQGESMKSVLSVYGFTVFTPQLALEVILLLALFFIDTSLHELREKKMPLFLFLSTLALLIMFIFLK